MATPPTFTTGQVLTAAQMNAVGLWLVKSQAVGTGVSSVSITSCFSSDYDNYVISYSNITASAAGVLYGSLLVGTTAQTNGWYGNTFYIITGAAGALSNATVTNSANVDMGSISSSAGYKNSGVFELQAPNLACDTRAQFSNADNNYWRFGAFIVTNATQYDGIKIAPSSGTLTGGTISIYGRRD